MRVCVSFVSFHDQTLRESVSFLILKAVPSPFSTLLSRKGNVSQRF